jgi:hypothetical protein
MPDARSQMPIAKCYFKSISLGKPNFGLNKNSLSVKVSKKAVKSTFSLEVRIIGFCNLSDNVLLF